MMPTYTLPEPQHDPDSPDGQSLIMLYAFKPSVMGRARQFELTDTTLRWQYGSRGGTWQLRDIAAIRLSFRPLSIQPLRFRTDIENKQGERLTLYSATWHSIVKVALLDKAYRPFVEELHKRAVAAGAQVRLDAGIPKILYYVGFALLTLIAAAILGLMGRALSQGQYAGALFLVGFAVIAVWQLGGFMTRNRPRSYSPDALPQDLLPLA